MVVDHWATVTMKPAQVGKIRGQILEHMGVVLPSGAANLSALKTELSRLDRALELCLDLLTNAQPHYIAADDLGRRELNQAKFKHLFVDDEIVASDVESPRGS